MEEKFIKVTIVSSCNKDFCIEKAVVDDHGYSGFNLPRSVQIGIGAASEPLRTEFLASWRKAVDDYNNWVDSVFSIPGFRDYFLAQGRFLTKNQIVDKFGQNAGDIVFRRNKLCGTQFKNCNEVFCDKSCSYTAFFTVEGIPFSYDLANATGDAFEKDDILYFFNWAENKYYTAHALLFQFSYDGVLYGDLDFTEHMELDYTECNTDEGALPPILETVKHLANNLKSRGYLRTYSLEPDCPEMERTWAYFAHNKSGLVEFSILDHNYMEDKELCEQIRSAFNKIYQDEYAEWYVDD